MNLPANPAPEIIDETLEETIALSLISSPSTLSPSPVTSQETTHPNLLFLETNLSSKRRRRLPSHLIHDYGVYRDDQTEPVLFSYLPHAQTSLYHPSADSSRVPMSSTKPDKKRKSLPNHIPPPPPAAAAPLPSPDESFSHLPRELRELYKTSNGFLDLTLDRRSRRENVKLKRCVDTSQQSALQICPQQLCGVRWEATKKRVYKFQRIESDDKVTSPSLSEEEKTSRSVGRQSI